MISQTAVFTRRVGKHMNSDIITVKTDCSCGGMLEKLRSAKASAAIVVDTGQQPVGIITEQDVSRRIAFAVPADTSVTQVMSSPLQSIAADDYLHHAVARMRREHIRHLPVVNDQGVIGLLELDQVLAEISEQSVRQIDLVHHSNAIDSLKPVKTNQFKIAAQLLADQVPAPEIQNLLTRLNNELYRAVIDHCLGEMRTEWGEPPVSFEVIVMGSGGRGENYLTPDQDNGIIIADYADSEHNRIDAWFAEFAERMTSLLNDIGFPLCRGQVMAINPLWRKTLPQWRAQIAGWISKGEGNFLRLCDIFFDFACVYGSGEMSANLRQMITTSTAQTHFLREMYKVDEEHEVALGWFGRLLTERRKGPDKGKLNLKISGTLPLVGAVRILALWNNIDANPTLERIAELHQKNVIDADELDYLQTAYRHITLLLLRQQLRDSQDGLAPGNYVSPKSLSKREKDLLVASFKAIRSFRSKLRTELTGELF